MSKELTHFSTEELSWLCNDVLRLMIRRLEYPPGSGDVDLKDLSLVWAGLAHNMLNMYVELNGVESVDCFYRFMLELFNNMNKSVKEGGGQ